jgi:hypothetical protein
MTTDLCPHAYGKANRRSQTAEKSYRLADSGGLFLRSADREKVWRMRYRFEGKEKTLVIGPYPEISSPKPEQNRLMQKFACSLALIRQKAGKEEREKYEATDSFGDIFRVACT